METVLAFVIGGLYAAAIYMLLRRSLTKLIIGLVLLSHAVHLIIFTVGGTVRNAPPLIAGDALTLDGVFADPVPQALILTAIVISFGVQAFVLVLAKRVYQTKGTGDVDEMRTTDQLDPI